jgi:hypothetical protein
MPRAISLQEWRNADGRPKPVDGLALPIQGSDRSAAIAKRDIPERTPGRSCDDAAAWWDEV